MYIKYDAGRPAPVPVREELYPGVMYRRMIQVTPHPFIAHVIIVDRKVSDAKFLITPADSNGDLPLNARTTSQFLKEFEVQIAINGDGFVPWWSRGPADYYPHEGDPVKPLGFSASRGKIYSLDPPEIPGVAPTLYISKTHYPSFNIRPSNVWSAVSGERMVVSRGKADDGLDDSTLQPRTAIGINQNGKYVYLIVIDGRQPFYSEGATLQELAKLMLKLKVYYGMNLDGGGSSTMVISGDDGEPIVLNSPIDNYIPGRERPVANHIGVFIR